MSLGDYLIGLAYLAAIVAAAAATTSLISRRYLQGLTGAIRILALAIVFTAVLIAVHLVPLALGLLSRPAALVAAVAVAVGVWGWAHRVPATSEPGISADPPASPAPPSGPLSWSLALAAVLLLSVYLLGFLTQYATASPVGSDFTLFHLPGVARWIQSGSVWHNNVLTPGFPVGAYPNNGDVVYLAAVLPWRNDAFVRLVNFPFLALVGLSTYAIARELGARRAAAVLLGAAVVSSETVMVTALDRVKPETMMLAAFGAGVLFLVRHARTGRARDLVLAGLGLGLAFGARWEGVEAVAVVIVAWAVVNLFQRAPRRVVRDGLPLVGLIAAAGGFWLVRNLVVIGNPVFPVRVRLLGVTLFHASYDPIRALYDYTIAGYLTNGSVMSHSILPAWRIAFGVPGALAAAGLVLSVVLVLRARMGTATGTRPEGAGNGRGGDQPLAPVVLMLAGAAVAIFIVYLLTPGSAQGFKNAPWPGVPQENARWAAPVLLLAGALTAWGMGRVPRLRRVFEVLAVVAVVDGIAHSTTVAGSRWLEGVALLAVLGVAAGATLAVRPVLRVAGGSILVLRSVMRFALVSRRAAVELALATGVVVAFGGVLALGYADQHQFNAKRYAGMDPTSDWVINHAPAHHRVGIAGAFSATGGPQVLAMFGPRLRNQVVYVGPFDGGFLRQYSSQARFIAALGRGHYDLILVGRGVPPRDGTPVERWTRQAGYREVARSVQWILFRGSVPG